MVFKTKYDERERIYTEVGSRFAPVYAFQSDKKGVVELVKTGEVDSYQEIQSHADSTDIHTILARFENGETGVLSQRQGQYVDVSEMPGTLAETLQLVINETNRFNELPLEIRQAYNFNASEFIADIGSEKWLSLMNPKKPEEQPATPPATPLEA